MSQNLHALTFEQSVPASPEAVYRVFTNATALREWLCDVATVVAREGGRCYLAWNGGYYSSGEYTRLVPGEEVAFSWHGRGEPEPSHVRVMLAPEGNGARVRLVHEGLGSDEAWQDALAPLEKGWRSGLQNLESIFSSGADLRFTQRPMLGITISDFNTDIAARMDVPVNEGICLDGVVPDMGAGLAGLREGDVVVAIDDKVVRDWPSLTNALQSRRAGDEVGVTFYRGPERREVRMTLSGRPLHEIPETVEELADLVRDSYAHIDSQLTELFDGVTEAQASQRSAPDAWSAREVLAHLIHSERDWQSWMAELVNGQEAWYDEWGSNLQARIEATLDAYPTTGELLEALRRLHAESAAFVTHLPPTFLQDRKASYWRLASQLLDPPYHLQAHLEQMREAIAAA